MPGRCYADTPIQANSRLGIQDLTIRPACKRPMKAIGFVARHIIAQLADPMHHPDHREQDCSYS